MSRRHWHGECAPVTVQTGWATVQSLAIFIVTVVVGLLFMSAVYIPAYALSAG